MKFRKLNHTTLCALCFCGVALILVSPLVIARFLSIYEWSMQYAIVAVYLEGIIPVVVATYFGARLGSSFGKQGQEISGRRSFMMGITLALLCGLTWILAGALSIFFLGLFFDVHRFFGGIVILAVFGFPLYATLFGLIATVVVKKMLLLPR